MTLTEWILQILLALVTGAIGWLSCHLFNEIKHRKEDRAWKRARHFLPDDTSKN